MGGEYLEYAPKETVISVIHEALDHQVNYLDLFMASPAARDNYGMALKGRRENVIIAGHLGSALKDGQYYKTRNKKVCEEFFHDLLRRLKSDCIDVLMLHFVDEMDDFDGFCQVSTCGSIFHEALPLIFYWTLIN